MQQPVAVLAGQLAVPDHAVQQDLDVDLVVGGVDAGRVVDEVGVHQAAAERVLDPGLLGQAEVAALADHLGPQLGGVDPDRVVGPVADVGVGLRGRLDVGADAAVPEQVDRRAQDRRDQLVRGQRVSRPRPGRAPRLPPGATGTDLADRGQTPPPAEISAWS